MHPVKAQRGPGILSGLWRMLRPANRRSSRRLLSAVSPARREELKSAELRGDEKFLEAELSKANVKSAANEETTKLTPINHWPEDDFESCQVDSEHETGN
jgi:hypothetical protein